MQISYLSIVIKPPLESQAKGTSLFTRPTTNQSKFKSIYRGSEKSG